MREQRYVTVDDLEVRAAEGSDPLRIIGHPVVYNRWSEDLGGFREMVMPGAATKTLRESDIRVLFNHDPNFVLGRNRADTAVFTEDGTGVRMEDFPPDTTTIRDLVIIPMQRKDITQMSFAFRVVNPEPFDPAPGVRYGDHWEPPKKEGGLWDRTVNEFQMFDGSIVTFPAYTQTDAAVRDQVGLLEGISGLDLRALTALLTRLERGIPTTDTDVDLLNGSIAVLRSYVPSESEPDVGDHSDEPPAGRSVAHLMRLLDLRERELSIPLAN
jgi:hypothetical protein